MVYVRVLIAQVSLLLVETATVCVSFYISRIWPYCCEKPSPLPRGIVASVINRNLIQGMANLVF